MRTTLLSLVGCCLVLAARPVAAQGPQPGPEHEKLKRAVGDWDATVAFAGMESKGTATYKVGLGGFWLFEEFQGDFGGQKFEGKGSTGYDPIKKKYVTAWTDSMSPSLLILEGNYDKDGKLIMTGEGPGMDGKPMKMKTVSEVRDNDTTVFTMYNLTGGKEEEMMKITYKRKK
jgi:hypothetical protein